MAYAEVAVDAPAGLPTYSYSVPVGLDVRPGQLVWVPFGARTVRGLVVATGTEALREKVRPILSVSPGYVLSQLQLDLGRFISTRYLSTLYAALALFLPPGIQREPEVLYEPTQQPESSEPDSGLNGLAMDLLRAAREHGYLDATRLRKIGHGASMRRALDAVVAQGRLVRREVPHERRVRARMEIIVTSSGQADETAAHIRTLTQARFGRQARILEYLLEHGGTASAAELRSAVSATPALLRSMRDKGLVELNERRVWRKGVAPRTTGASVVPVLTAEQCEALAPIRQALKKISYSEHLLFGVTGSGKTELYLRATQITLDQGRQVVCLVPEIGLAAQAVERFSSRFPGRVALLHSGLSGGQQLDEWERVQIGASDIVVGPRSALFAPLGKPGLIILDEEHEWTYKQDEVAPRYHARDVARELARTTGAVLLLGSATPDIETFHRVAAGDAHLSELPRRIGGGAVLPPVDVIDMRDELRHGNPGLFSRTLRLTMSEVLTRSEQVLLFLNRRGTATLVQCRRCSYVFMCPRCSVALAHHSARNRLLCHRCNYSMQVPDRCAQCGGQRLRFVGVGTQRVVDEVHSLHPDAHVIRWDSDVPASTRGGPELQDAVLGGQADVIVGTQMVAKGHDFPGVTLVGVISADVGLSIPDYRSGERVFQLLCQAAGRAGRGIKPGRVIVQTYEPENYVVSTAASHDYRAFYDAEIRYRLETFYPPFCSVVRLVFSHVNEERCRRESERVRLELDRRAQGTDLRITGPSPAFVQRLRGRYRWHITVRGSEPTTALTGLNLPRGWVVDVDPASVA